MLPQQRISAAIGALTFLLAMLILLPDTTRVATHGDEDQYIWTAAYFGGKLSQLDFAPTGSDGVTDPGWDPETVWTQTQPMGARWLYSIALGATRSKVPALPWLFDQPPDRELATTVSAETRLVVRYVAVLSAAVGLALIAARVGPVSLPAILCFLAIPHVRDDLTRAWAEGPLLLGFGLCAIAFGTRWFPIACGIAASFKLTALGLWPLALWPRVNGGRRPLVAAAIVSAVWSVLTPPSWFVLGPFFLPVMIRHRILAYAEQSIEYGSELGVFAPSRYLWPFELLALVVIFWCLFWCADRAVRRLSTRSAGSALPGTAPSNMSDRSLRSPVGEATVMTDQPGRRRHVA
jgi:hypothetical protein